MVLPRNSMSAVAVRRMWASGVCQRMISGTMVVISEGSARSLSYWSGFSLSASRPPRDRVAGGVVAADDQQDEVAQVFHRGMSAGGLAVGQHRDQIVAGGASTRSFHRLLEIGGAFHQLGCSSWPRRPRCSPVCGVATGRTSGSACAGPRTGSRTGWPASGWSARWTPGRPSRTSRRSADRRGSCRPLADHRLQFGRLPGETIGLTTLRWASCLGGSMAMNIGSAVEVRRRR